MAMKKLALLLLVLALIPFAALAQQNQQRVSTITTAVFTQTVSTFQQALASSSRNSCTVQYNGTGTGFVYFGLTANATSANSFKLTGGQSILCAVSGVTLTDAVNLTSTATGDSWAVTTQ